MSVPASNRNYSTEEVMIAVFSMAALLIHLLTNGQYGYFRDELYWIACARHFDCGYFAVTPATRAQSRMVFIPCRAIRSINCGYGSPAFPAASAKSSSSARM